jgi:hypothetical protein
VSAVIQQRKSLPVCVHWVAVTFQQVSATELGLNEPGTKCRDEVKRREEGKDREPQRGVEAGKWWYWIQHGPDHEPPSDRDEREK